MNRNDVIMWAGRILTIVFSYAVFADLQTDSALSREIKMTVISFVGFLFASIFVWQVVVAYRYDGMPFIPFSFRWVMAAWAGSLFFFIAWLIAVNVFPALYSDLRSAVMYWQLGTATLWFMSRWFTVNTPHRAGIGETGASAPGSGA